MFACILQKVDIPHFIVKLVALTFLIDNLQVKFAFLSVFFNLLLF